VIGKVTIIEFLIFCKFRFQRLFYDMMVEAEEPGLLRPWSIEVRSFQFDQNEKDKGGGLCDQDVPRSMLTFRLLFQSSLNSKFLSNPEF